MIVILEHSFFKIKVVIAQQSYFMILPKYLHASNDINGTGSVLNANKFQNQG